VSLVVVVVLVVVVMRLFQTIEIHGEISCIS
jgi:hypothetical protein